ncbi:MAG: efflux RND transporter periplasmic adaptor subunit [Hyphomicrobiaceae bacterium]
MRWLVVLIALVAGTAGLYSQGYLDPVVLAAAKSFAHAEGDSRKQPASNRDSDTAPLVSIVAAQVGPIADVLTVTGSLVPRLEVLVAPEVEGLRIVALNAEEGDQVAQGATLARLEQETLKVQLVQNDANIARARAAIEQARSNIASAEARRLEAARALSRALPLSKSGTISDSVLDQRQSAATAADAALGVARSGLALAQAELAQTEAQRRDIAWRLGRTEIKAPVAGIVSRRTARIGAVASGAAVAEPMFRIIADGEIELEAEVPEADMHRLKAGQRAQISIAGAGTVEGQVRLAAPEIDRSTRQGRVRIALGRDKGLRIGSFGRGKVMLSSRTAITLPASAVLYSESGTFVQVVQNGRVRKRPVTTGIEAGNTVEIRSGVNEAEIVIAKSGTFLREGDAVRVTEQQPSRKVGLR